MKRIDSIRHTEGKKIVVRLLSTRLMDKRWLPNEFDWENRKKWGVIRYPASYDKYIPNRGNSKWDTATHNELGQGIAIAAIANKEEPERNEKARELFRKAERFYFWTDDWEEAEKIYLEWCNKYCDKVRIKKRFINIGLNEEED